MKLAASARRSPTLGHNGLGADVERPPRVLHVLASLNRGGAETWLMDVVRNAPRTRMAIDVCLTTAAHGPYEEEFESLGGRVHRCLLGRNPWRFAARFRRLLGATPYDVIHSHLYYFSGFVLRAAARAGVPRRIAHNHPVEDIKSGGFLRAMYTRWMRRWMVRYGTHFVGPTEASLEGLWGPDWKTDPHKTVIYNGLRVDRFAQAVDRDAVRQELGLAPEHRIVLNVGRFAPHKRQGMLVAAAKSVLSERPDARFVLLGDGPLRGAVEEEIRRAGLTDCFRLIPGMPNIDRFWLAADLFAFPSCNEGFGIVIAEAAAAGLHVVAHDIPGVREAAKVCGSVQLLPVDASSEDWAQAVIDGLAHPPLPLIDRRAMLERFPLTIEASICSLDRLYAAAPAASAEAGW